MEVIHMVENYTYGTSKDLVSEKEKIKSQYDKTIQK